MFGMLFSGFSVDPTVAFAIMIIAILGIIVGSGLGFFEYNMLTFLIYSNLIQFSYFLLDYFGALYLGKDVFFASLQLVNYAIAGFLFSAVLILIYMRTKDSAMIAGTGLYSQSRNAAIAVLISGFALGGLPGFNIFVGEYLIYGMLFGIHPALAMITIFGSLLAFIFYFKAIYIVLVGENEYDLRPSFLQRNMFAILMFVIILLGVYPRLLFGLVI